MWATPTTGVYCWVSGGSIQILGMRIPHILNPKEREPRAPLAGIHVAPTLRLAAMDVCRLRPSGRPSRTPAPGPGLPWCSALCQASFPAALQQHLPAPWAGLAQWTREHTHTSSPATPSPASPLSHSSRERSNDPKC